MKRLTAREICELHGCTERTAYKWLAAGDYRSLDDDANNGQSPEEIAVLKLKAFMRASAELVIATRPLLEPLVATHRATLRIPDQILIDVLKAPGASEALLRLCVARNALIKPVDEFTEATAEFGRVLSALSK